MFNRKGQSTLEYALIIGVVVAGLLLMQHYVRRGLAGRYKSSSDDLGESFDPSKYTANFTVGQSSNVNQFTTARVTGTKHISNQVSSKTGTESLNAWAATENLYSK